jgi:hypothetical protein
MRKLSSLASVVILLAGAGAASAASINVAILSALANSNFDADVVAKITADAPMLNITVLNVNTGTPTMGILDQYQAVMVIGSQTFLDAITLGNNLKQYIDQGHGVVITADTNTATTCSVATSTQLCGAFQTSNYWAIDPGNLSSGSHATLGTVVLPSDPIVAGISAGALGFDGGSYSFRITGSVDPSATLVANWSDGTPLIATRKFGSGATAATEVALNFLPPSADAFGGLWVTTSQGALIMANAFNEVAGVTGGGSTDLPEPATYLAVGSGLGLLALLLRRRRGTLQCESVQRSRQR